MDEQFLTATEAAEFLRITKGHLYHLTSSKAIPYYKPCKKIYFKKEDLETYITESKRNPTHSKHE